MLGYMDQGIVWRIPPQDMDQAYLTNPRAYYCPMYFYDGTDPYPETYMHGANIFFLGGLWLASTNRVFR